VADLIDLAQLQSSNFARKLGGGEVWGSAGSIADVVDLRHTLDPVDAETERDSLELRRLLIRLAEQMKAQGISSEGSEFVASAFRRGLERRRS
jgi:pyruvate/2-oxoglutarate/acetoin dehydrogenase E1 component